MNRETDNAAGELIHDDHYSVTAEQNRLATEQVDAPQAVFRVPEEGKPGGAASRLWSVMPGQNPPDDILIDLDPEEPADDESDPRTTKAGVVPLDLDDGLDYFCRWSLRPWFPAPVRREEITVLLSHQRQRAN